MDREQKLDEVITEYLKAVESGANVDSAPWLARYPDLAGDLTEFFADQLQVERVAAPLRRPYPAALPYDPLAATITPANDTLQVPAREASRSFADYEVVEEIARGGMGVVYKARQKRLNRVVALKMILSGVHAGDADRQRFQTEAQAIARLQHPHIVQVYEVGEHDGCPFLALEFCPGGSLEKKLNGTPLPSGPAAVLMEQIAGAVQAAHEKGVVHRDLKPANVLLGEEDTPKVADFGLAKRMDMDGQTQSGAIMGTPSYMAPEQASGKGKEVGPAADVYALGAILYECLTGRPPFRAATPLDTILQVVSDEPVPPSRLQSKVPRDLETIALKCLRKEPHKRYVSARALADDLRRFQKGEPIAARPVGRLERGWRWCRRNPALALASAAAVLLLVPVAAVSSMAAAWLNDEQTKTLDQLHKTALAEEQARKAKEDALKDERAARKAEAFAREQSNLARRRHYTAQMNLAARALEDGDVARALALLEELRPRFDEDDLRGFEWYLLWGRCRENHRFTLRGHTDAVSALACSPDGKVLASAGHDTTIRLWNLAEGTEQAVLRGHTFSIFGLAFASDGKTLYSAAEDGIRIWDLTTRKQRGLVSSKWGVPRSIAVLPGDKQLAIGTQKGHVVFWDLERGEPWHVQQEHPGPVVCATASSDGAFLATASAWSAKDGSEGNVTVWDLSTDPPQPRRRPGASWAVAFSPDGKQLLIIGSRTHSVLDPRTGEETAIDPGIGGGFSVTFVANGAAVARPNRVVSLWERAAKRHKRLPVLSQCYSVAATRDGSVLAAGSQDGEINVWNVNRSPEPILPAHGGVALTASANGKVLAVAHEDRSIRLWNVADHKEGPAITVPAYPPAGLALSPDGSRLAWMGQSGAMKLWDTTSGRELADRQGYGYLYVGLTFSPDGRHLIWRPGLSEGEVLDATTLAVKARLPVNSGLLGVAFSKDSSLLAVSSVMGDITLWEKDGMQQRAGFRVKERSGLWCLALSPDARLLAAGGTVLKLYDTTTGRTVASLKGHAAAIRYVAFSPDGKTLLSHDENNTLRFWDVATGLERVTLKTNTGPRGLLLAPDGKALVVRDRGRHLEFWSAAASPEARAFRSELDAEDVDSPVAHLNRGVQSASAGRWQDAEDAYRKAVTRLEQLHKVFPETPAYREHLAHAAENLGRVLLTARQFDDAVTFSRRAVELRPESAPARLALAAALLAQQQQEGANEQLREVIERLSPTPGDLNNAAWRLVTTPGANEWHGRAVVALAKQSVERPGANRVYMRTVGAALVRTGEWEIAITALEESMRHHNDGDAFEWYLLALAYTRLGQMKEARQWFDRAAAWTRDKAADNEELRRFHAEAAQLLER